MFDIGKTVERQLTGVIKGMVGTLVAAGGLGLLYVEYGELAAVLSAISTLGVLHLVIEYNARSRGGGKDSTPA